MWRLLLALGVIACGRAASRDAGVARPPHSDWSEIAIDYPVVVHASDDQLPRTAGRVALSLRAPAGTKLMPDTAYVVLPGDHIVLMTPDEDWPTPRADGDHAFVSADCTRRRLYDWDQPLAPWAGHVDELVNGIPVCRGPGIEGIEPSDCYTTSVYLPAAHLECGIGTSCGDKSAAELIAEVCASVRRR